MDINYTGQKQINIPANTVVNLIFSENMQNFSFVNISRTDLFVRYDNQDAALNDVNCFKTNFAINGADIYSEHIFNKISFISPDATDILIYNIF